MWPGAMSPCWSGNGCPATAAPAAAAAPGFGRTTGVPAPSPALMASSSKLFPCRPRSSPKAAVLVAVCVAMVTCCAGAAAAPSRGGVATAAAAGARHGPPKATTLVCLPAAHVLRGAWKTFLKVCAEASLKAEPSECTGISSVLQMSGLCWESGASSAACCNWAGGASALSSTLLKGLSMHVGKAADRDGAAGLPAQLRQLLQSLRELFARCRVGDSCCHAFVSKATSAWRAIKADDSIMGDWST